MAGLLGASALRRWQEHERLEAPSKLGSPAHVQPRWCCKSAAGMRRWTRRQSACAQRGLSVATCDRMHAVRPAAAACMLQGLAAGFASSESMVFRSVLPGSVCAMCDFITAFSSRW
jgi:hypothetical protein